MLAISLDNLLFFLLIAVAALFQLLSKTISKAGKTNSNEPSTAPKPQTPGTIQRPRGESDADRIRKFLEALGQPPGSTPPPPVLPRNHIPPRPLAPVQPPPVTIPGAFRLPQERRQKRDLTKEQRHASQQPGDLQQSVPSSASAPPSPAFEVHEPLSPDAGEPPAISKRVEAYGAQKSGGVAQRTDLKMDIATLLTRKSKLREAIVLREILGTPRGLQPLDFL